MKAVRTTLTLDPEVASLLEKLLRSKKLSAKELINRALKWGLLEMDRPRAPVQITTEPWDAGRVLVPDLTNVGEMLALLDEKSEDCT